jgi:hypothetical protein
MKRIFGLVFAFANAGNNKNPTNKKTIRVKFLGCIRKFLPAISHLATRLLKKDQKNSLGFFARFIYPPGLFVIGRKEVCSP